MTNQEIFDKVATHLLMQGKKSMNDRGECVYRNAAGRKCAVGCLIPEELYSNEFEGASPSGTGAKTTRLWEALSAAGLDYTQHAGFLWELQCIHDEQGVDEWRNGLLRVALHRDLSTTVLS